jgi:type IV fimbrial biogenesis protein FimT
MRKSTRKYLGSSGFTMTELLIVSIILVILATIAIPAFSRWLPQYRLKQAARDLYSTMQSMKMAAVKNNQTTDIVFSTAPHQYQYALLGVNKTVVLSDYGSGVKFEDQGHAMTFTASPLTFDGRGFGVNIGDVYLSNDNNTDYYKVVLGPTGAISLQKWNGSAYN